MGKMLYKKIDNHIIIYSTDDDWYYSNNDNVIAFDNMYMRGIEYNQDESLNNIDTLFLDFHKNKDLFKEHLRFHVLISPSAHDFIYRIFNFRNILHNIRAEFFRRNFNKKFLMTFHLSKELLESNEDDINYIKAFIIEDECTCRNKNSKLKLSIDGHDLKFGKKLNNTSIEVKFLDDDYDVIEWKKRKMEV